MATYTLVYRSVARNLDVNAQAALMQSSAPLPVDEWTLAGLDLTTATDTPSVAGSTAIRTIVIDDAPVPGVMPAGAPMAQFLTGFLTGTIANGITMLVTADPVGVA